MKHLTEMVRRHKEGKTNGIYAVCSAHPLVLEAAIRYACANQTPLLIEKGYKAAVNKLTDAGNQRPCEQRNN